MATITFNKNAKKQMLELLDKEVNEEGLIVEKEDKEQKVLALDGSEIHIDNFGGIKKGSEVFIKSDLPSLLAFSKSSKN